jgi:hypothetical protein
VSWISIFYDGCDIERSSNIDSPVGLLAAGIVVGLDWQRSGPELITTLTAQSKRITGAMTITNDGNVKAKRSVVKCAMANYKTKTLEIPLKRETDFDLFIQRIEAH